MRLPLIIACLLAAGSIAARNVKPTQPLSQQMAATAMHIWADSFVLKPNTPVKWSYDMGVILKGIEGVWYATGEKRYFDYLQRSIDFYVTDKGEILRYRPDEYNIDHVNNGKNILTLYRVTGRDKYRKAATLLRGQLLTHPRTKEGGFWHKQIYPWQMWLDGLYMGQPFYAEYAALAGEDSAFNDITRQFRLMERYARDPKTGLLYHGWDESREQAWANKATGRSPHVWARAMGWFGMAMVDALDYFPESHPGRAEIIAILRRFAQAVVRVQDKESGVWYDILDQPGRPGNYLESSASSMLVYALAKGIRKGYLPESYRVNVHRGFEGIVQQFIEHDSAGRVHLKGTVSVSGLGGKPYRDGSFEYYMSEPVITDDPKGIGAFIQCAVEVEMIPTLVYGKGLTVTLDNHFNREFKTNHFGRRHTWHYTWDDMSNSGYSLLGHTFQRYGARLQTLEAPPTAATLKGSRVYIIVDPDTDRETESPNFLQPADAAAIRQWVSGGGVLVLLANDAGNSELERFNRVAGMFGIHFNENNFNRVANDHYPDGEVRVPAGNPLFPTGRNLFIKELSTLRVTPPALPLVRKEGHTIMASARFGKGTVFALGDPWVYNEYVDGRKLPPEWDNFAAMEDWVRWLLKQARGLQ